MRKPPPGRFDNARAMLRSPLFWILMAVLTALMLISAILLSDYFHSTAVQPAQNTGRLYRALDR